MPRTSRESSRFSWRSALLLGSILSLAASTAACSGDDDAEDDGTATTSSGSPAGSSGVGPGSSSGGEPASSSGTTPNGSSGASGQASSSGASGQASSSGGGGNGGQRSTACVDKFAGGDDDEAVLAASEIVNTAYHIGFVNDPTLLEADPAGPYTGLSDRCAIDSVAEELRDLNFEGYADDNEAYTQAAPHWLGYFLGCPGFPANDADDQPILNSLGLVVSGQTRDNITDADFDEIKLAIEHGMRARWTEYDIFYEEDEPLWSDAEIDDALTAFETWRAVYVTSDDPGHSNSVCVE